MVNPVNPSSDGIRAAEQAAQRAKTAAKTVRDATQQDTAEVSTFAKELEGFVDAARQLPDVRPEVVTRAKETILSTPDYPPLDVIAGFGNLMGTNLQRTGS